MISEWAARNPKIRRVWVSDGRAGEPSRPDELIVIALELQPVADSEESFAVWIAHGEQWRRELQARVGRVVDLAWLDPDQAASKSAPGREQAGALVYEQAS